MSTNNAPFLWRISKTETEFFLLESQDYFPYATSL